MTRGGRILGWVLVVALLGGCRITEMQLEGAGRPTPTEPAVSPTANEPAPTAAAEPTAPVEGDAATPATESPAAGDEALPGTESAPASEPTEPGDGEPSAVQPHDAAEATTPAAPPDPEPTAEPAAPPVDPSAAAKQLQAAAAQAIELALAAARTQRIRQGAAQAVEQRHRARRLFAECAKSHDAYLRVRVEKREFELAVQHLAVLKIYLDGVRANLGPGPAADEIAFALGALYDVSKVRRDQNEAAGTALGYLRRALARLPEPAPALEVPSRLDEPADQPSDATDETLRDEQGSPAADEAVLAREVTDIVELLEKRQNKTGRDRLRDLVLKLGDDRSGLLVELAQAARRDVMDAVAQSNWTAAEWGLGRLSKTLDELLQSVPVYTGTADDEPLPTTVTPPAAEPTDAPTTAKPSEEAPAAGSSETPAEAAPNDPPGAQPETSQPTPAEAPEEGSLRGEANQTGPRSE